jgi:rhomboid protease GluP
MSTLQPGLSGTNPAIQTGLSSAIEKVYLPRRGKQWRLGILCLVMGLAIGAVASIDFIAWGHGGPVPKGDAIITAAAAVGLLVLAGFAIRGALLGLPRLTVTSAGLKLDSSFGTCSAEWNSLSDFAVTTTYVGRFNRRVMSGTATITGTQVSKGLLRRKSFIIPNAFPTPIDVVVAELNARNGGAPAPLNPAMDGEKSFGIADFKAPWLTLSILIVLAAVFAGEQVFSVGPIGSLLSLDVTSLQALGGLNSASVLVNGEWYRLFTAPLLHADLLHIVFNGIALLMVGYTLERFVGRLWFFAFFVIGALGGSLMSIAVNSASITSVGASGAIMGLFAAGYVSYCRLPEGKLRRNLQTQSVRVLLPSLIPLATTAHIDYGAHLGGALSGAVAGFIVLKTWPETSRLPRFRRFAAGIAVIGIILMGVSVGAVAGRYLDDDLLLSVVPPEDTPKTPAEWTKRAAELLARYPKDPRPHMFLGVASFDADDFVGAERELRAGLKPAEDLNPLWGPEMAVTMRGLLALSLFGQERLQEAKDTARELCSGPSKDALPEELNDLLIKNHLCE